MLKCNPPVLEAPYPHVTFPKVGENDKPRERDEQNSGTPGCRFSVAESVVSATGSSVREIIRQSNGEGTEKETT